MRVLVLCDMEGVAGINHWDQVQAGGYLYEEGRTLYTNEVNAAIRGARAGGATDITVIDSHGAGAREVCCKFNSLRPDRIDPGVRLVTGQRYMRYDDVLKSGFDAALFVGIHAKENTPGGVLSHTISSSVWSDVWINGEPVGEIGIMSALVGAYGIPMAMIAGDKAACEEARALLGEQVVTAAVKEGLSRFSAVHLSPARAHALLEEAAATAVKDGQALHPYVPDGPVRVRYRIKSIDMIDTLFRGRFGVTVDDAHLMVETEGRDFLDAWWTVYPW